MEQRAGDPCRTLGYTLPELTAELGRRYGRGAYHAEAIFRTLYSEGGADVTSHPRFRARPELAEQLGRDYALCLPELVETASDADVTKLTLRYADGARIESVLIPMRRHLTLCVSSQVGCSRGCLFCATGAMGLERDLGAGEIVAQLMVARFVARRDPERIVFMGMGEPMDNLDNVLQALRVMTDQRGLAVPHAAVSISTVGEVPGILRLARLSAGGVRSGWRNIRLAVSLAAADDALRARLVTSTSLAPLAELYRALAEYCAANDGSRVFIAYVLLPGVNDGPAHARALAAYLHGLRACVNVIPCVPPEGSALRAATAADSRSFYDELVRAGQLAKVRPSRGGGILASCGQLATGHARAAAAVDTPL